MKKESKSTTADIYSTLLGLESNRIFGLDILRASAVLLVLVSHGKIYLDDILGSSSKYLSFGGFLGVELFFVLSGFLIGGILIKIIDKKGKEITMKDISSFWIRRWFRTLPNYYLVLFINVFIVSFTAGYFIFDIKYLFFLQNFVTPIQGDMNYGQSWSLTIEEWFYLSTPLILFTSIKLFKFNVKKTILFAILSVIFIYPLLKYAYFLFAELILNKGDNITFQFYRSVAILRLDTLLYGVLISYINFYYKEFLLRRSKIFFSLGLIALIIIIIISELMIAKYPPYQPHIL